MPTYTAPTTRTTGELISAAIFNTDLVENIKYFKDAPAFAGNITVAGTLGVTGAITSAASVALTGTTNNLGTITSGVWNAGAVTSSGTVTGQSASFFTTSKGGIKTDLSTTNRPYLQWVKSDNSTEIASIEARGDTSPQRLNIGLTGDAYFNITGTSTFSGSGTGGQIVSVRQTTAGTGNYSEVKLGNDGTADAATFQAYSTTYTTSGASIVDGSAIRAFRSGGLSIAAENASGTIRFYSGGTTERMRLSTIGQIRLPDSGSGAGIYVVTDQNSYIGIQVRPSSNVAGGEFIRFLNAAGSSQGGVTATNSTTTAFNTSSDKRIKRSHGVWTDVESLRNIVIHDAEFLENGARYPMVFAQQVHQWVPEAITVGGDGDDMSRLWSADYSKFTPRLIVGWQQHDATIATLTTQNTALEARIATLEARLAQ